MARKKVFMSRNELVDLNKEFDKVIKKAEGELMRLPGVVAVGVGLKEVKGEVQPELCFKVTVRRKKERTELKAGERIPDNIYGFKTDVTEILTGEALIDDSKYRPLVGGSSIQSNNQSGHGTLGCFAKRDVDGKIVVLSNWHVMVGNPDTIDGARVGQPSHNGCCSCCACGEIGTVTDGWFKTVDIESTDNIDAAIALLDGQESDTSPDERFLNEILELGMIVGSAAPVPGEQVFLRGRTSTSRVAGRILNNNSEIDLPYDNYNNIIVSRKFQTVITPEPGFLDFNQRGDSGAVCVNLLSQAVLMVYGRNRATHQTFANNIQTVEKVLKIKVLNSAFVNGLGNEGIPLRSVSPANTIFNLPGTLEELEAELTQFREGKRMLELFKTHRPELLDLVNHKREVMAAWNRYQGPSYLAHIARSIRRQNKPVPEQIKGITLQSLLLKMTAVLQRNGSPELRKAVAENYLQVMDIISSGRTPQDWRNYLVQVDEMIST
jgi:hypothetical protein